MRGSLPSLRLPQLTHSPLESQLWIGSVGVDSSFDSAGGFRISRGVFTRMFPTARQRSLLVAPIVAIAWSFAAGCEQTDWNWDPQWWRKPRRVIRPSDPRAMESDRPTRLDPHIVPVAGPTSRPGSADALPTPTPTPTAVANVPSPVTSPTRASPFRRLFLISGTEAPERGSADVTVRLAHASAESCARLLESLYVPTARLGSADP